MTDLTRKNCYLPLKPADVEGGKRFVWARLDLFAGSWTQAEYEIDAANTVRAFKTDTLRLEKLHYGAKGSFELAPPAWPEGKVVEQEKMDAAVFMRLMGAVAGLLAGKG